MIKAGIGDLSDVWKVVLSSPFGKYVHITTTVGTKPVICMHVCTSLRPVQPFHPRFKPLWTDPPPPARGEVISGEAFVNLKGSFSYDTPRGFFLLYSKMTYSPSPPPRWPLLFRQLWPRVDTGLDRMEPSVNIRLSCVSLKTCTR